MKTIKRMEFEAGYRNHMVRSVMSISFLSTAMKYIGSGGTFKPAVKTKSMKNVGPFLRFLIIFCRMAIARMHEKVEQLV